MNTTSVRIATWNLYLGADIVPIVAPDLPNRPAEVARFFEAVEATRFADRAAAIAQVLARVGPDVIGIQEMVRFTEIGPSRVTVLTDHLALLLAALDAAGSPYQVVERAETYAAEYPWAE